MYLLNNTLLHHGLGLQLIHESIFFAAMNGNTRRKTTVRVVDARCRPATQDPTGSVLAGYLQMSGVSDQDETGSIK